MAGHLFAETPGEIHKCNVARAFGPTALLLLMLFSQPSAAQTVIAYPAKGQDQERQDRDRFECYNWAVQQTGYNPQAQVGSTTPPTSSGPTVMRGAARGAAVGAVGGAIAGDAGKGAAVGAATGGLLTGMRRRDAEMQQNQINQQHAAASAQQTAGFNRAMGACLQGRGYSVN